MVKINLNAMSGQIKTINIRLIGKTGGSCVLNATANTIEKNLVELFGIRVVKVDIKTTTPVDLLEAGIKERGNEKILSACVAKALTHQKRLQSFVQKVVPCLKTKELLLENNLITR